MINERNAENLGLDPVVKINRTATIKTVDQKTDIT